MKKSNIIAIVLLSIYVTVVLGIYISLVYPATIKPRGLVATKIPSLSVTGLKEVDALFSSYGKGWIGYPAKPDLSKFSYGQTNPF